MLTNMPNIRSVVDQDGAVILDIPRNAMTTLNSTGAYIWQCLNQGMSLDAIVAQLANDTGTDATVVTVDVATFMEELKSRHLFVVS
jgi:hypothetical protein